MNPLSRGISFIKRQERDWKVTVLRTSLDKLAYQIIFPYLSIYIVALGASGKELGLVNSIGMIAAGMIAPFIGWFIDRTGPKRLYLMGIACVGASYLTYGLAGKWEAAIIAMAFYWLGISTSIQSCATICGNCLANRDRAKGMMICETVAAGILGMLGPMIATSLVAIFGGVNVQGIRPLFFLGLVVTLASLYIVTTRLSDRRWTLCTPEKPDLIRDIQKVFKEKHALKRWMLISSISYLPIGMILPFTQVYAHAVKGAGELVLGLMVTASAVSSIAFAIPLGHLADRIGRKKVLYFTTPIFWASIPAYIFAPSENFLILAGFLQGFFFINAPIIGAIERELVPKEEMGRWLGINRFFKMTLGGTMAIVSGLVWDWIGPHYIFIIFLLIDVLIRFPMLISMPETLQQRTESL